MRQDEAQQGGQRVPGSPVRRKVGLQILVFVSGAVLMALEIAGSRVLAPHFGNSVFVWGSLISVVLVALSLGYFFGGRLADRYPSRFLLNSICVAVALILFGIAVFSYDISEQLVESGLSERSGPFVCSLLLFLPPSIGMGLVSPFAIRLSTHSVDSVGRSSGTLYALSTVGSIVGTLLMTFVLIPQLELPAILKGLAVAMLLAGVLTYPFSRWSDVSWALVLLGFTTFFFLLFDVRSRTVLKPGDRVVLDTDSPYHHITVVDNARSRELRFDRYVESAIRTTPPYDTLSPYTNYFHLAFLQQPDIGRSVFIGAGGGVGPRAFHRHAPQMEIDVVDIDSKVLNIAQSYFFLNPSDQIHLIAQDGRMFLRKVKAPYDCIVLDAFTIGGRIPFHLVTREFFALCRDRMTPGGVFIMNINSAINGPRAEIFRSMLRTLDSVFPQTYVFALDHGHRGRNQSTNIILLATNNPSRLAPPMWMARAQRNLSSTTFGRDSLRRMVSDLVVDVPDVSQAQLFTDRYAPIETMSF